MAKVLCGCRCLRVSPSFGLSFGSLFRYIPTVVNLLTRECVDEIVPPVDHIEFNGMIWYTGGLCKAKMTHDPEKGIF